MSLESRRNYRHPVDIPVHIRYRKRRFFCARARKLSAEGMYLEVQSLTLPVGTLVELEFQYGGEDYRLPAVVTDRGDGGVGVLFSDPQIDLYRDLSRMLRPAFNTAAAQPAYP